METTLPFKTRRKIVSLMRRNQEPGSGRCLFNLLKTNKQLLESNNSKNLILF